MKSSKKKFKAVEFMRSVREELGVLYFADRKQYFEELRKAVTDFEAARKRIPAK